MQLKPGPGQERPPRAKSKDRGGASTSGCKTTALERLILTWGRAAPKTGRKARARSLNRPRGGAQSHESGSGRKRQEGRDWGWGPTTPEEETPKEGGVGGALGARGRPGTEWAGRGRAGSDGIDARGRGEGRAGAGERAAEGSEAAPRRARGRAQGSGRRAGRGVQGSAAGLGRARRAGRDATVPGGPHCRPPLLTPPRAVRLTVALAVSTSASWLMLDTSGELFMMTRMRDRGSDTSRGSPHLSLPATPSAISAPRPRGGSPDPPRGGRPPRLVRERRPAAPWEL